MSTNYEKMRYKKAIALTNYVFNGQNMLINFLINLQGLITDDQFDCDAELINNFGTISLNNIQGLIEEIRDSDGLLIIKLKLHSENECIHFKLYVYEDLKNRSSIQIMSNNRQWIESTEKRIFEILPDKNLASFLNNAKSKFIISIVLSLFFMFLFFSGSDDMLSAMTTPQGILLIFLLLFITIAGVDVLLIIFIPTFVIRKNSSLLFRIKSVFKSKEHEDSITINYAFLILSALISTLISILIAILF